MRHPAIGRTPAANIGSTEPRLLYHYTTAAGLIGIMNSGMLWATDLRFLNDSAEYREALDTARKWLLNDLRGGSRQVEAHAPSIVKGIPERPPGGIYVTSFSTDPDALEQWRAYARTGGYAIGFDADTLAALARVQGFQLRRCVYATEPHGARAYLEPIKTELAREVERMAEQRDEKGNLSMYERAVTAQEVAPAAAKFYRALGELAPTLKHASFAAENEWRLVTNRGDGGGSPKFRPSGSAIVPYVEFDLRSGGSLVPVAHIVVGPTAPDRELALTAATELIRYQRFSYDIIVEPSKSTFRGTS